MEELGIQVKEMKFVCKNFYVASNGERQHAYCYLVTDYVGEPVCKAAQEIFWEDTIKNLSLEIDKETVRKIKRKYRKNRNFLHAIRLNCTHEREDQELDNNGITEKLSKTLKTTECPTRAQLLLCS